MANEHDVSDADTLHRLWIPDNPDGSGWAKIDWTSAAQGSRYHYRHGEPLAEALALRPPYYLVRTRSESEQIPTPHENTYFIPAVALADFLAELTWNGGAEIIWHIEPVSAAPPEAMLPGEQTP